MSDRAAMLAAIEAAPDDDTVRLAYADWLDEFGTADADRATAEFIRVSCGKERVKTRQSAAEGRWLEANWPRLLPAAQKHWQYHARRHGRWLSAAFETPDAAVVARTAWLSGEPASKGPDRDWFWFARMEFWKGFVRAVTFDTPNDLDIGLPDLAASQPLLAPDISYDPVQVSPHTGQFVLTHMSVGNAFFFLRGDAFGGDVRPKEYLPLAAGGPVADLYEEPRWSARQDRRKAYRRLARFLHHRGPEELARLVREAARRAKGAAR